MRTVILSAITIFLISCGTNKAVYQSPDFEHKTASHKVVAILPVRMIQTGVVGRNNAQDEIKATNEKLGYVFQESLQSFILRETVKNKKGQMVSFQPTQKTNALLKNKNIEDLYSLQPEELAKLLGVDAVIMTTLSHNKNFSDEIAYGIVAAKTLGSIISKTPVSSPNMNASDININCSLYDAADSKLLWKTYRDGGTDLPSNVEGMIESYSNWIAKKLPYKS